MARRYSLPWPYVVTLKWLRQENHHASGWYRDLCAMLAALAAGWAGCGHASASVWGRSLPDSMKHYGTPSHAGVLLFWATDGWGHVAWYIGRINGVHYVLCNDSSGGVSRIRMDYYRGLGNPFWVEPTRRVFANAFGYNPYGEPSVKVAPKPAVKPAPKPAVNPRPVVNLARIRVAARDATTAPAISRLKHALKAEGINCGDLTTDRAGGGFSRGWLEWEHRLGVKHPNSIPGRASLTALGNRHGFGVR